MTDKKCATCRFYWPQKGTYGICRPLGQLLPFWATKKIETMQTNVRPDEGRNCLGWKES